MGTCCSSSSSTTTSLDVYIPKSAWDPNKLEDIGHSSGVTATAATNQTHHQLLSINNINHQYKHTQPYIIHHNGEYHHTSIILDNPTTHGAAAYSQHQHHHYHSGNTVCQTIAPATHATAHAGIATTDIGSTNTITSTLPLLGSTIIMSGIGMSSPSAITLPITSSNMISSQVPSHHDGDAIVAAHAHDNGGNVVVAEVYDPLYDPRRYRDDGEDDHFPGNDDDNMNDEHNDGYLSPVSLPSLPASRSPSPGHPLVPPPSTLTPIDASLPTIEYDAAIEAAAAKWARTAARSLSALPSRLAMARNVAANIIVLPRTHHNTAQDSSSLPGTPLCGNDSSHGSTPPTPTLMTKLNPNTTMTSSQATSNNNNNGNGNNNGVNDHHHRPLTHMGESTRSLQSWPPATSQPPSPLPYTTSSGGASPGSTSHTLPRRIAFLRLATPHQQSQPRRSWLMPVSANTLTTTTSTVSDTDAPSPSCGPLLVPPSSTAAGTNMQTFLMNSPSRTLPQMSSSASTTSFSLLSSPAHTHSHHRQYHQHFTTVSSPSVHATQLPTISDDLSLPIIHSPPSSSLPLFPSSSPLSTVSSATTAVSVPMDSLPAPALPRVVVSS